MTERELDGAEATVVERLDPMVGRVLAGRFRIDFQIAAGGFGAIYQGVDLESGVDIALKVLHPRLASDRNVVARFKREGEVLVALRDPHTVTAYQSGEAPDGTLFIAMELLDGESLQEHYRAAGALPWRRVLAIARAVCGSLAEAHALGIVHRDLKPANIHLERRGDDTDYVKVLDFGIAKVLRGADLTHVGQMIGTFDYMSPEQMVGGQITGCSDIYTLGVVMYEMIAGQRPFPNTTSPTMLLARMLTSLPPPLSHHAHVPSEVEQLVMSCLDRDPLGRFTDVTELAAELERVLQADDTAVTLRRPAVVLPAEATLIGLASPLMHPRPPSQPQFPPARLATGTSPIVGPAPAAPVPDRRPNGASQRMLASGIVWGFFALVALIVIAVLLATS